MFYGHGRRPEAPRRWAIILAEYTSAERFPLTTVRGLPAHWQMGLDAANLAWLSEVVAHGGVLSDLQQRRLNELQEKAAAHPQLEAEVARCRAWRDANPTTDEEAIASASTA
jgi:hypothetical protein